MQHPPDTTTSIHSGNTAVTSSDIAVMLEHMSCKSHTHIITVMMTCICCQRQHVLQTAHVGPAALSQRLLISHPNTPQPSSVSPPSHPAVTYVRDHVKHSNRRTRSPQPAAPNAPPPHSPVTNRAVHVSHLLLGPWSPQRTPRWRCYG